MKKSFLITAIFALTLLFSIPAAAQTTISGDWTLHRMVIGGKETPLVTTGKIPTANFTKDGFSGNGSCNSYGGSYTIADGKFKAGPIRSTKMACAGEINAQEMAYFSTLEKIDKAQILNGALTLYGEGGLYALTFVPKDKPAEPEVVNHLWIINKEKVDCQGVAPQKCLQVKKTDAAPWENFYGSIAGFKYKPGKYYLIRVQRTKKKNVPADASAYDYKLIKVMSRTRLMPHVD